MVSALTLGIRFILPRDAHDIRLGVPLQSFIELRKEIPSFSLETRNKITTTFNLVATHKANGINLGCYASGGRFAPRWPRSRSATGFVTASRARHSFCVWQIIESAKNLTLDFLSVRQLRTVFMTSSVGKGPVFIWKEGCFFQLWI